MKFRLFLVYEQHLIRKDMDLTSIKLNKGDREYPAQLLLQYSYYLNKSATKQVLIGFDTDTFKPYILLTDSCTDTFLHFSYENWRFINECLDNCINYLNDDTQTCWESSTDKIWKINLVGDCFENGTRTIVIKNTTFDREITFNLEELTVLNKFAPYLTRMIRHYDDKWGFVKQFYKSYLLKCFVGDVDRLPFSKFFKNEGNTVNYFRLFNEIPVLCNDKLIADLQDLYSGNV